MRIEIAHSGPLSAAKRDAFAIFYREHYRLAQGYLRRFVGNGDDNHDILTHSFELALARFDEYLDAGKPRYWFIGIVRNSAGYFLRRQTRESGRISLMPRKSETPEELLLRKEEQASIEMMMAQLPEKYREVAWLRFNDFSFKEIADTLNLSVSAAESRMRRAVHMLEPLFARYLEETS